MIGYVIHILATKLLLSRSQLKDKVLRRNEDDKHQAERHQRRAVDALRSYIKHLEPPVRIDDSYDKIRSRIERSEEYLAVSTDELRRSAFEKVVKRLKEKEEDLERDRLKRRDRASVDRSSHRDRDRDRRSGGGRPYRSSRSPEVDAYEADRRKAIADREKNYRKGSAADSLLSPPRRGERDRERERDRDHRDRDYDRDRERDYDRPSRSRREPLPLSHYDRERRDREEERERMYRRRGDPRGSIDELPYGDETKPASTSSVSRRRRADSDVESTTSARVSKVRGFPCYFLLSSSYYILNSSYDMLGHTFLGYL